MTKRSKAIEPVFWQDEPKDGAMVLPMVRPG
jgi:hypothetical protein